MSDAEAELKLIEVDVSAVVDLCSRFVPGMVDRGRGAVLNVASVGAFGPVPGQATYGAAKAFVLSYTDAMRARASRHRRHGGDAVPGTGAHRLRRGTGIPDEEAEKSLPKFLWKEADEVAKTAIDGLASGKRVIVPGAPNRIAAVINHHLPRRLLLPMVARNHPGMKKTLAARPMKSTMRRATISGCSSCRKCPARSTIATSLPSGSTCSTQCA